MASEVEALVLKISRSMAATIASPTKADLRGQLVALAAVLTGLPGIAGAVIVALEEEGDPLTAGAYQIAFSSEQSELETLFRLHQQLAHSMLESRWVETAPTFVRQENGRLWDGRLWVLPVCSSSRLLGMVLVTVSDPAVSEPSLQSIAGSGEILAAAIHSSLQSEAWNRIETLQQLAWKTFAQPEWDLSGLVHQLAKLFEADAVTILLKEQEELRLSASTDPELGRGRQVVYQPGQGLTGYVFKTGNPLRLSNTDDREEIRRSTGLKRRQATHPEYAPTGMSTGQFLGVAMRFGGKVVGVLRISRRRGIARFTREDEKALQFFADLLGAALAPTWDLLLEKSVLESVTELIAVSRWEQRDEGPPVSRIVKANPGAEKLLGRSREQIEGIEVSEIYDTGEYEEVRRKLRPALAEAREKGHGTLGPIRTKLRRLDGTGIPVMVSYRVLTNRLISPPTLYTIGLARDLSESEELAGQHARLLELLGTLKVAYFSANAAGITQFSTQADSDITGYSQDELKAMSREELFPRGERARLLKRAQEGGGRLVRGGLAPMVRKDGTPIWAEGDLRILKDPQGREIGSEGLYRDVTDRIRLQGFVNADTKRVLSENDLFKSLEKNAEFHLDYMSSLGHQLQTPLGSLVETLRNFEVGVLSQKDLATRLPYVIGQAIVCTRLVRNLSYMDKILRGEPFQLERVSLARLAIETKLDFIHLIKEKRLELHVDDESLNRLLNLRGHREMLRQVVVNLVDNAIKYSLPGSSIDIRAKQWPEGSAFEITSQGLPIPEEDREKIFQRGFRTEKAQAIVPHGTGLGLWLVRKIVEAHGATIRCQDVLEGGHKCILFRILFPKPGAGARRIS